MLTMRSRCCNNITSEGRPFQVMGTAELKAGRFFLLHVCTHLEQRERVRKGEMGGGVYTGGDWRGKRNSQDGVEPTHFEKGEKQRDDSRAREAKTWGLPIWFSGISQEEHVLVLVRVYGQCRETGGKGGEKERSTTWVTHTSQL